MTEITRSGR